MRCNIHDVRGRGQKAAAGSRHHQSNTGISGRENAIALVITLIMLAVVTVMAIIFLGISRRERTAVSVTVDLTTARFMADHALARAQAQLVGRIAAESNLLAYDFQVSTNFINPNGFRRSFGADVLNVGYTYSDGTLLDMADLRQNVANLFYDPRPPVFITTNWQTGELDFRFFHDINRNGRFETNGLVQVLSDGLLMTNSMVGDPEWIGVLERPEWRHSASNLFIGRYAYIILPAGKSLDINFIHNSAKARGFSPPEITEGYMRNQGVGSWEINLAAFLEALMPRMYQAPYLQQGQYLYRPYWLGGDGASSFSDGDSFYDALSLLSYGRINLARPNILSVTDLYDSRGAWVFRNDAVDGYGAGPVLVNLQVDDAVGAAWDNPLWPWWGSDRYRAMDNIQEWFDPSRSRPQFVNRLQMASALSQTLGEDRASEYDYTYARLLAQMGADSSPANRHKLNLNYVNVDITGRVVPHLATNFVEWTPVHFFTNAAARLLREQFNEQFGDLIRIDHIPIYPTNYYSSVVHRLLQLAANIYDASTNRVELTGYPYLPSVFRPVFNADGTNIFISGFVEETRIRPHEIPTMRWLSLPNEQAQVGVGNTNINIHGIPWVVGAKKGWPNFNEFHLQTSVLVSRRLEAYKPNRTAVPRIQQSYEIGISNLFGVELWNSYHPTQTFTRALELDVNSVITFALRDELRAVPAIPIDPLNPGATNRTISLNRSTLIPANTWNGEDFQVVTTNVVLVPPSEYWPRESDPLRPIDRGVAFDQTVGYPIPDLKLQVVTNRLMVVMVDSGTGRVVDFVNLDGMAGGMDITANLVGRTNIFADRGLDAGSFWITNRVGDIPGAMSWGITNQLYVSTNDVLAASDWRSLTENPVSGQQKQKAIDDFRLFMGLPALFDGNRTQPPIGPRVQVPFSPARILDQSLTWQANDPLVHYHLEDLYDPAYADVENVVPRPPGAQPEPSNLGRVNQRYRPWGGRPGSVGDQWAFNPGVKDPMVRRSDDWEFPTNRFASIGWLGRVHRGTPWQTFYLKSPVEPVDRWTKWSLRGENHPTNDWRFLELFTTAVNDNAVRGLLGVNQTNMAAWSAVLGGVAVLSNSAPAVDLTVVTNAYTNLFVEPNSPQMRRVVESLNLARQAMPNQTFRRLGHVLSAPALTVESPFLNLANDQLRYGINDRLYEWIPQQILGLLKEDEPYVVVYAYGQSLRPADRSLIVAPGPFQGLCTNYQITGEVLTKTALRFEEIRRTNQPSLYRAVAESYNILAND